VPQRDQRIDATRPSGRQVRGGPAGRPADDVVSFTAWIGFSSAVMLGAGLLACVEPARRALRINPIDALRDA
jgi:hypothetical protein